MHRSDLNADLPSNVAVENAERKSAVGAGNWRLGDLTVGRIGFGTKRLGGRRMADLAGADEQVLALLRRVIELGVNHLDTAAFYPSYGEEGNKHDFTTVKWANDAIRQALAPYSDDLVISTKVGPTEEGMARPDQLRALVENDLRQLGLETLDVVYLRQQGLSSVAEHFGVLADLRKAGLIRNLGLSNVRAEHLAEAQEIAPVVAVSNRYGVGFGRVNDAMVEACGEQGIAFVPFFAVTGIGREVGGVAATDPVVAIANEHGATPAQIRIAWTLARGNHVLAIPGTGDPVHLAENVAAAVHRRLRQRLLPLHQRQVLERLRHLAGPPARAPCSPTRATRRSTPRASRRSDEFQSKLTLMSESLRNDGRIWVPRTRTTPAAGPDPRGRARLLPRAEVPELRQPVPRDVASRNAKTMVDEGGRRPLKNGVYLDFAGAIKRLGATHDRRALRQPLRHVPAHHRRGPV